MPGRNPHPSGYTGVSARLCSRLHRAPRSGTDAAHRLPSISYAIPSAPAVLTENLFMDNPAYCAFLLSPEGQQAPIDLYVAGVTTYLSTL